MMPDDNLTFNTAGKVTSDFSTASSQEIGKALNEADAKADQIGTQQLEDVTTPTPSITNKDLQGAEEVETPPTQSPDQEIYQTALETLSPQYGVMPHGKISQEQETTSAPTYDTVPSQGTYDTVPPEKYQTAIDTPGYSSLPASYDAREGSDETSFKPENMGAYGKVDAMLRYAQVPNEIVDSSTVGYDKIPTPTPEKTTSTAPKETISTTISPKKFSSKERTMLDDLNKVLAEVDKDPTQTLDPSIPKNKANIEKINSKIKSLKASDKFKGEANKIITKLNNHIIAKGFKVLDKDGQQKTLLFKKFPTDDLEARMKNAQMNGSGPGLSDALNLKRE